jgi:hypothetical protein
MVPNQRQWQTPASDWEPYQAKHRTRQTRHVTQNAHSAHTLTNQNIETNKANYGQGVTHSFQLLCWIHNNTFTSSVYEYFALWLMPHIPINHSSVNKTQRFWKCLFAIWSTLEPSKVPKTKPNKLWNYGVDCLGSRLAQVPGLQREPHWSCMTWDGHKYITVTSADIVWLYSTSLILLANVLKEILCASI